MLCCLGYILFKISHTILFAFWGTRVQRVMVNITQNVKPYNRESANPLEGLCNSGYWTGETRLKVELKVVHHLEKV